MIFIVFVTTAKEIVPTLKCCFTNTLENIWGNGQKFVAFVCRMISEIVNKTFFEIEIILDSFEPSICAIFWCLVLSIKWLNYWYKLQFNRWNKKWLYNLQEYFVQQQFQFLRKYHRDNFATQLLWIFDCEDGDNLLSSWKSFPWLWMLSFAQMDNTKMLPRNELFLISHPFNCSIYPNYKLYGPYDGPYHMIYVIDSNDTNSRTIPSYQQMDQRIHCCLCWRREIDPLWNHRLCSNTIQLEFWQDNNFDFVFWILVSSFQSKLKTKS